jgi:phosphohistidine phosphatase
MDLVLWRHAQAEDVPAGGGGDMARALTSRGHRQAESIGAWLHAQLPKDARLLVSPARRTIETARALPREREIVDALAPDVGTAEAVLDVAGWTQAGSAASSRTVVVVGHQPVLGTVAALLMCGRPLAWSVKKGAVWWLRSHVRGGCELWTVRPPSA